MALKMLQAGALVNFVMQVTGYTAEEIRSLQAQYAKTKIIATADTLES